MIHLLNYCYANFLDLICKPISYFFNLQNERVAQISHYLNDHLCDDEFKSCECLHISLYCLLDRIRFRELADFSAQTQLVKFHEAFSQRQATKNTNPRLKF